MYFLKKLLLYSQALIRQTKYVVMMTKIVNFMTPGAGLLVLGRGHIGHIVKMRSFFKNLLLYSPRRWSDKLSIYLWWQNCKFHKHIHLYSEYVLSSSLSKYFTLIDIVLKENDAAFLYHCFNFYLFYDRAVDM